MKKWVIEGSMSFKIGFYGSSKLVRVVYYKSVTLEDRINVVHEICTDYYNTQTQLKVLIDARLMTQVMTETEQIIFGTYVASREELQQALVAVLVNSGPIINQMVVKKASQLGHQVRLFTAEDEALTWLNATKNG